MIGGSRNLTHDNSDEANDINNYAAKFEDHSSVTYEDCSLYTALLKECLEAFNLIPNTRLKGMKIKQTYNLAAKIERTLKM